MESGNDANRTPDSIPGELKAHLERPVDAAMLAAFCDGYEASLEAYADLLQAVVAVATDQRQRRTESALRYEPEIDAAVSRMDSKHALFKEEMATVFRFLTELRATSGTPVTCRGYTGDSAHWLAASILNLASKSWQSCKEIAERSRTDPAYLYPATASSLFFQTWIEPQSHPAPNDLGAIMRLERASAERALIDRAEPRPGIPCGINTTTVEIKANTVTIEGHGEKEPDQDTRSGDSVWRDIQCRLMELYDRGERYTSVTELANRLACSRSTIQKAMKPTQSSLRRLDPGVRDEAKAAACKLCGWQARHSKSTATPRATSMNDVVTDNAEQIREVDPAKAAQVDDTDIVLSRLIDEAQPEERARINGMSDDERRKLAALLRDDPDRYDKLTRRMP